MTTIKDLLCKAIDHKVSIPKIAAETKPQKVQPSDELNSKAKYSSYAADVIPSAVGGSETQHLGYLEHQGKGYVVRHGAAAHRTDNQHSIARLMGADHMMPEQSYDANVHAPNPEGKREDRLHKGTLYQELVPGEMINEGADRGEHHQALRNQWRSGDLHRLWGAHYIGNDTDNHGGNFKINDKGVQYFDSDHSFPELPYGHILQRDNKGKLKAEYMGGSFEDEVPSYVKPFVHRSSEVDSDGDKVGDSEGIDPIHSSDKEDVAAINNHANMINPELFKKYGPHAYERAIKVKEALSSGDPTKAMMQLWQNQPPEESEDEPTKPESKPARSKEKQK